MSEKNKAVFQVLQKDFTENVNLVNLIPLLNGKKLLTASEEQDLTNKYHSEYIRILELTKILRRKGPSCPAKVLECLQNSEDDGHTHLAKLMEDFLGLQRDSPREQSTPILGNVDGTDDQNAGPSNSMATIASASTQMDMTQQGSSASFQQDRSSVQPLHQNPGNPQEQAWSHSHVSCPQSRCLTFSPQYSQLITELSSELVQKGIGIETILEMLKTILWTDGIQIFMEGAPTDVTDFISLSSHLKERGMCHETDTDLWCKLFAQLQLDDLLSKVHNYATSISTTPIMEHQGCSATQPLQRHMLVFSYHNSSSLTVGQVYEIKTFLARLSGIPRHTFTFTEPQTGSIILVWRFPAQFSKQCVHSLETQEAQEFLSHNIIHIECLLPKSTQRETIFSATSSDTTSSGSSDVAGSSVLLPISPPKDPDSLISSTVDDHESSPVEHSIQPCAGAKRSASPTSSSVAAMASPPAQRPKYSNVPGHSSPSLASTTATDTPEQATSTSRKRPPDLTPEQEERSSKPPPKRRAQTTQAAQAGMHEYLKDRSRQDFGSRSVQKPTFGLEKEVQRGLQSPSMASMGVQSSNTPHPLGDSGLLKKRQPELVKWIKLLSLVPYLNRHSLLTDDEQEMLLNTQFTERERILRLLALVEKKGRDGFESFLKALEEEPEHLGHKELVTLLRGASIREMSNPRTTFAANLKAYYTGPNFYQTAAGPGIGKVQFIRLALIKKKGVSEDDKERDKFLKSTLHGLVDDIVKKKEEINMYKIFKYTDDPRKLVLVEGAPGVGKTMLAMKLCEDWARGRILQEFDLVVLVQLRRFQGVSKLEVKDIVEVFLEGEIATEATQDLINTGGEKVMFFLEGWDELSPQLRQEFTFFFDIITGHKLPKASVMVTSRPTVTAPLYDYMDERRIEVLGFNQPQIEEFVHMNAADNAIPILDHLKQFPNLRALAHIPLTLVIICYVMNKTNTLPPTLTALYDSYICISLLQNLRKQSDEDFRTILGLNNLSELPSKVQSIVQSLCRLALTGFEEKSFVFQCASLKEVGLTIDPSLSFDGYGLLSTPIKSATAGHELLYQFRHLSIQEFLAALQIKELDNGTRIKLLQEYRNDKQFQNVWKFLAGLTELKDEEFKVMIISDTTTANRDQLFLLHCLYEAHSPEICRDAAAQLNRNLNLNNMTLNPTDCLCTAYTMTSSGGEWTVDFRGCNIGAEGMEILKLHLISSSRASSLADQDLKIASLNLMHNKLTAEAVAHLAEMIKGNIHIVEINLGSNKMGNEGAKVLADALAGNEVVKSVHFSHCGLTDATAEAFAETLRRNSILKNLFLGFEPIGDAGVIHLASALVHNEALIELSLTMTDVGRPGLEELAKVLEVNKTLEVLRLDRDRLKPDDCHVIASIIRTNEKLALIDVSKNPIGDEGFSIIIDALTAKPQSTLKKLGVFGCEITGKGVEKLINFFAVTENFQGIQLGCNHLGDEGAEHIAKALASNVSKSVKEVMLEDTKIFERGRALLDEVSREGLEVTYTHHTQVKKLLKKRKEQLVPQQRSPVDHPEPDTTQ